MKSHDRSVHNRPNPPQADPNRVARSNSNLKTQKGEQGVGQYHGQPKGPPSPQENNVNRHNERTSGINNGRKSHRD